MALTASQFYIADYVAAQQGDIVLVPVARVASGGFSPQRWVDLDEEYSHIVAARAETPEVDTFAGWSPAMVTTHDCGLDKEFNAAATTREQAEGTLSEAALENIESDLSLDRFWQVSPLIDPVRVEQAGQQVDQGLLLAGKVVGYLPVPRLEVNGEELLSTSVVDLNYRVTVDRLAILTRVSSISEEARTQLRYALARVDALRTPGLSFELSSLTGSTITTAKRSKKNPLTVDLTLGDGRVIRLVQEPHSPSGRGAARTGRSAPPAL